MSHTRASIIASCGCGNRRPRWATVALAAAAVTSPAYAAVDDPFLSPTYLKRLPLEQLADVEVTSVSRRPEKLSLAPSAIDVITGEDVRRAGVTNIPDALRLATGLHVAQIDGHTWAISARGFNGSAANKLQVLMDGRSLYTPLFSGVFWDVQQTFLPDLERIEVIRGPGAALWGANAVNGVINIRTKSARETQGLLFQGGGGNEERGFGGVRYGGQVGRTYYRAYVTHLNRDSLRLEGGGDAGDDFAFTQGGFRTDSELSPADLLTVQGDLYTGRFGQLAAQDVEVGGGNVIARWNRELGAASSLMLQAYYDRTHRVIPGVFEEARNTYDVELQHRFPLGSIHDVTWGLNYRVSEDQIGNLGPTLAFLPDRETLHLLSAYLQDTITVLPERLFLTLGSKFEVNSYTGFELQPTARFALRTWERQTLWGAVSRAVRTPTRIDQHLVSPNPESGATPVLISDGDFDSEELLACELGYRWQALPNLSFDLATFYHEYDRLRSQEPQGETGVPIRLENKLEGESYGAALTVNWQPASWWKLHAGFTVLETEIYRGPGSRDVGDGAAEGNDPNHLLVARSSFDLPHGVEFDLIFRYVDRLPEPQTPAYFTMDVRLGWEVRDGLEVAVVGRNLLDDGHPEFRTTTTSREVQRSVFGTVTWRF